MPAAMILQRTFSPPRLLDDESLAHGARASCLRKSPGHLASYQSGPSPSSSKAKNAMGSEDLASADLIPLSLRHPDDYEFVFCSSD